MGETDPQALVVTHWFDSGNEGEPYSARVRFTGRRVGPGRSRPTDRFVQDETVERVVPGTGRASVTAWVYGLRAGDWTVDAALLPIPGGQERVPDAGRPGRTAPAGAWSWRRWAPSPESAGAIRTRWAAIAPLARQPAVLPGAYPVLTATGLGVALALQAVLLARTPVAVGQVLVVSLVALLAGLAGAKLWYAALHPDQSLITGGWAVDGFLVVAPLAAAAALLVLGLPLGVVLDASTPGIFFGVAIGRIGCFLTGCCAGRCSASACAIWSSDRRVGARRIPTQLLESGAGLVIGITSLIAVLAHLPLGAGTIFVLGFVAYAVVRQVLLRLRAETRRSPISLPLTAAAVGLVIDAVAILSYLRPGIG